MLMVIAIQSPIFVADCVRENPSRGKLQLIVLARLALNYPFCLLPRLKTPTLGYERTTGITKDQGP
jgi:hypothetical protein